MTELTTGALRPQDLNFALSPAKDLHPTTSSKIIDATLRFAAFVTGGAIIAANTATVIQGGGLVGPDAALVAAMAAGVACGSVLVSRARKGMALAIVVALVCGEAYGLLSSAERIVTRRENQASITNNDNSANVAAKERLAKAEARQVDHSNTAIKTVATPSCGPQCRTLLQEQASALAREIEEARKAVVAAPAVRSASPLADRLGWQPWALDLVAAVLLSIGANLLGATLVGFGGRPGARPETSPANYARRAAVNLEPIDLAGAPACPKPAALISGACQPSEDHDPVPPAPKGGVPLPDVPVSGRTRGLLQLIHANGGALQGSQRALATSAGLSKGGLGRALEELVSKGVVDVVADRLNGTVVRLRAA